MSTESSQRRLEALAARARERSADLAADLEQRGGTPPGPGDLFVLQATAELPVEWAILDRRDRRDRRAGGELLAVPADASPLAGVGDVEVPAGAPGGPLVLRCRFAVWLDGSLFDLALWTGALAAAAVAEALDRRRQLESGELDVSPLAEEVEADPEYQDWIREVPARARELSARPPQVVAVAFDRPWRPWRAAERLAAVLALVALGLSLWIVELRREVDRLSAPIFGAPSEEVDLGGEVRGSSAIRLPRDASHLLLTIAIDPLLRPQDGRVEIVNAAGALIWHSPVMHLLPGGELPSLMLPRELLPDGEYHVRIVPIAGTGVPVDEVLSIETAE